MKPDPAKNYNKNYIKHTTIHMKFNFQKPPDTIKSNPAKTGI